MKSLFDAIMTKFTAAPGGVNNALFVDIGGRLYTGDKPDDAQYPYAVFSLVTNTPERTFTERFENPNLQLSLYSTDLSYLEVEQMLLDARSFFDECSLSITGYTLIWMRWENENKMEDEIITDLGTQKILHYAIDYDVKISLN